MRSDNVARYGRARAKGWRWFWQKVACPDGQGGWRGCRHRCHVLDGEARYGHATWSAAKILADGSARVQHGSRWRAWRPSALGRAPRPRTNARRCGSRRSRQRSSARSDRGDPDPDDDPSSSPADLAAGSAETEPGQNPHAPLVGNFPGEAGP